MFGLFLDILWLFYGPFVARFMGLFVSVYGMFKALFEELFGLKI